MASRKRRNIPNREYIGGLIQRKRETSASDMCSFPLEGINPSHDPNQALLRRVFFLNEDRNKYVSVAFDPEKGYTVHVEYGAAKTAPLKLTEQHFLH
jgi:hypothetical protein